MKQILVLFAATIFFAGTACTEKDGPAERAGERLDDAVSNARDRLEDAGDEIREAGEEIGDALRDE
jgi:hypothetical protein